MSNENSLPNNVILKITRINITFDPLPHKYSEEVMLFIERMYATGLRKGVVQESIKDLNILIGKYPNIPVLYNYLASAYEIDKNHLQSRIISKKCYDLFPDYIFGACNWARFLFFESGDPDVISKMFKNKFDLKDAFPKRKKYHISEFEQFYVLQGYYWAAKGNLEVAKMILAFLEKICKKNSPYISMLRSFIKKKSNTGKDTFLTRAYNQISNFFGN
jgi:hypothetical protein